MVSKSVSVSHFFPFDYYEIISEDYIIMGSYQHNFDTLINQSVPTILALFVKELDLCMRRRVGLIEGAPYFRLHSHPPTDTS